MKHKFNPFIIREYDVRGVFNETLKPIDAEVFGYIFAKTLIGNKIVNIGMDGRISSLPLKKKLINGLTSGGAYVYEIEMGPTPMLYYSSYLNDSEAGIMITGSHNPASHNGFKIIKNKSPFFGEQLKILMEKNVKYKNSESNSKPNSLNTKKKYIKKLISCLNQKRKLDIAWDAGNGAAGEVMSEISNSVNGKQLLLFNEIDGNFPNHHPDPSVSKNLEQIIKVVKEQKLDFGIAFDGDGDRIGVVDNHGRIIPGDILLLIFAQDLISRKKDAKIIADVKCSQVLFDYIQKIGGQPLMSKTGHSLIKIMMKKENADIAGEMSGHMFFADKYYGFDDALYAAIRLVNLVSSTNKTLSEIVDNFPKTYNTPEIRIDCDDELKFSVIERIIHNQKNKNINLIDGLRVNEKNGWWLLRASNTQPCLVIRCEANSEKNLEKIILNVKCELENVSKDLSNQIIA